MDFWQVEPKDSGPKHLTGRMLLSGSERLERHGQTFDAQLEQLKVAGCAKVYREKAAGAQVERHELQRLLKAAPPATS